MARKRIALVLILWILCLLPMTAYAQDFDPDRTGSIAVRLMDPDGTTPIAGAELSLYYVASVRYSGTLRYSVTDAFADCPAALDDPALAGTLNLFVEERQLPARKLTTDEQGNVLFSDLPLGLYFVKQTGAVMDYAPCTPFLVTVPNYGDTGYLYDVNASPKTDVAKLTSITVRKVWNTDKSASPTDSVSVRLMLDGVEIATAVLNEQNQWQVVYTNMPESDGYSIVEVEVPKGFVATYSQDGYLFTVTNSAFLIQTGQLIWPIPVLAMAGLCLIAVGTILLRKPRKRNA